MYTIKFANGDNQEATDFYGVLQLIGSGCHIKNCGDRWLVWASEEESRDDDGAKAIAEIKKA